MLGALIRSLLPEPPSLPATRPIVQTNEPEGPGRGDGFACYGACPLLDLEPEHGFPVLVVRGRRAL